MKTMAITHTICKVQQRPAASPDKPEYSPLI